MFAQKTEKNTRHRLIIPDLSAVDYYVIAVILFSLYFMFVLNRNQSTKVNKGH